MNRNLWWLLGLGGIAALLISGTRGSAMAAIPPAPPGGTPPPTPLPTPGSSTTPAPAPTGTRETGTQFAARVTGLSDRARDDAAVQAAVNGNVPAVVTTWLPVPVSSGALRGTVYVSSDFFGVGTDADWVRWPVFPAAAQRIADVFGAVLPTKKIADAIHAAATTRVRLQPSSTSRDAIATYVSTNARTERILAGRGGLRDGLKKNILVADSSAPGKIIIYGAENPDTGAWPLQSYASVHSANYRDYSHGVRLVRQAMDVDGRGEMAILDVMRDPTLAPLVSDRRVDRDTRYA